MTFFNPRLILFIIPGILAGALLTDGSGVSSEPQKVEFIRKAGFKGHDWYRQQAALWEEEVKNSPGNPEAWFSYYLASEYRYFGMAGNSGEKEAVLERILKKMRDAVPASFEYYLLKNCFDHSDFEALEKAYRLRPDNPDTYYELILHYEIEGNTAKFKEFNKKLYQSRDVAAGLLNYNYNMLMSTAENAILFTNGDNDTYPAWMLQEVKNVRSDILVLNAHLAKVKPEYLQRKLAEKDIHIDTTSLAANSSSQYIAALCRSIARSYPQIPVYFAVTVYKEWLQSLTDSLYMVGLAYRYHPQRFDNIAILEKNVEKNFRLDYLIHDWYSEFHISTQPVVAQLNTNYISLMMILYEHYAEKQNINKAEYYKNFAEQIARETGKMEELQHYLKKSEN